MCCGLVMTSGAGTSLTGPTFLAIWRTQPRQIASCSRWLRLCGSQMTPPLPPPSGMSTTEHFHVIHVARARTVSSVSCGWKRMPPLVGPRASLCWTRDPRKTFTAPSSMRTGTAKENSRIGLRSKSRVAASRLMTSATLSNWACAISNGLNAFLFTDYPLSVLEIRLERGGNEAVAIHRPDSEVYHGTGWHFPSPCRGQRARDTLRPRPLCAWTPAMLLLKNADLFAPSKAGRADILIAGGRIERIDRDIHVPDGCADVVDGSAFLAV